MGGFIIGAIAIGILWLIVSICSKTIAHKAFNALDAAEPWLSKQGLSKESLRFSVYSEQSLARTPGASVVVALAKTTAGKRVGFALEVMPGNGVVASEYIEPEGIITHHKSAAQLAKMHNVALIDTLRFMAHQHREKYPHSSDRHYAPNDSIAPTSIVDLVDRALGQNADDPSSNQPESTQQIINRVTGVARGDSNSEASQQSTQHRPTKILTPEEIAAIRERHKKLKASWGE